MIALRPEHGAVKAGNFRSNWKAMKDRVQGNRIRAVHHMFRKLLLPNHASNDPDNGMVDETLNTPQIGVLFVG